MTLKEASTLIKVKKLIYYKKISRHSYLRSVEMTSRLLNVLAGHSVMSFLAIEESLLSLKLNHQIYRHSYLRFVEMTLGLVNVLACHSEMSFLAIEESLLLATRIHEISRRSYLALSK